MGIILTAFWLLVRSSSSSGRLIRPEPLWTATTREKGMLSRLAVFSTRSPTRRPLIELNGVSSLVAGLGGGGAVC
jgi:hypothetical protein